MFSNTLNLDADSLFISMSVEAKLRAMFILGFEGECLGPQNKKLQSFIKAGLGGVIFFAHNISSYEQTAKLVGEMQKLSPIPLFTAIDQEGGKIQRTRNITSHVEYLSPSALALTGNPKNVAAQTEVIARELLSMGMNMNFAPVLDVNTNPQNPIIGERAFGNTPEEVTRYAEGVYKTFQAHHIIPVGKHFPGHGDTQLDSHLALPHVDLPMDELERLHIAPFADAFSKGLDAVMVAHVHYSAFNKEVLPASLSTEVISDYLKGKLGFKGLIISDDMVMQGVAKGRTGLESFILAINAGIDLLIYKDSDNLPEDLFEQLALAVRKGIIPEERVNESARKILEHKARYGILSITPPPAGAFDVTSSQKAIDKIRAKA